MDHFPPVTPGAALWIKDIFITPEDPAVKMWLPACLALVELPEDLAENRPIRFFSDEQFDHSVTVIFTESEEEAFFAETLLILSSVQKIDQKS